jgi:hypothetical protein
MVDNDNAGLLAPRGVLAFIAVGASLLAMVVNDNAGCLTLRGVLAFIASELAPTGRRDLRGRIKCNRVEL